MRLLPSDSARAFLVDGTSAATPALVPDCRLEVSWKELDAAPMGELVFDSGGCWRLHRLRDRDVYRFFADDPAAGPYKEAEVTQDARRGRVRLDPRFHPPGEPVDALQYPLDELLFLRLFAARGAVELHACGVVAASGEALVFAGQSGDGKTTTARLWEREPGAVVLSDDRIVVRRDEAGALWAYGTPWHGEAALAASRRAPLAAVLVLTRGERDTLAPLPPAAAFSLLLARSFPPFYDAEAMARTMSVLEAVVQSVPCLSFSFVPGPGAVRSALQHLAPEGRARAGVR
jgi:hypothetical protein